MRSDIASCTVHIDGRIVDAMRSLDRSGWEIVLVVDDAKCLVGTVTDGDVRRALLAGAVMQSPLAPHVQRNCTVVGPGAGRTEVLDIMQARTISAIPIVDEDRRLLGLHLIHELVGTHERSNWAVVMAGGKGTRLAPLTENVPKPMIRVAGRPILERIVLHLVSFGIRRIFLAVHYLGHQIESHFGDGSRFGCRIEYLKEESPLGTAGALGLLPERPTHPLLVMNGDLVTQADVGAMLDTHAALSPRATVGVRRYFHTVPFGCVDTEGTRIVRIEEKPQLVRLINAGIYVLDPALLDCIVRNEALLITNLLEDCLGRGERVQAFEIEEDWIDVGQRDQLRRAAGKEF